MFEPRKLSAVGRALPTSTEGLLPDWKDIPDDFKRGRGDAARWTSLVSTWFFRGLKNPVFTPKPWIDLNTALAHIKYCLRSWEPSHEHKEAGCAYLLSLWFEDVKECA